MRKEEYLEHPLVNGFIDYLIEISNNNFEYPHQYKERKKPYRKFEFKSLESALKQYSWANKDYFDTAEILAGLSLSSIESKQSEDEFSLLYNSLKILEWGEVYRGGVGWLADSAESGNLLLNINMAVNALESEDDSGLKFFKSQSPLRMDSGTTKIFSLMSNRSIIYDDRVAAALGLFIVRYLKRECVNEIPDVLDLMQGCSKGDKRARNGARNTDYIFTTKTKNNVDKGFHHAKSNLYANWIIEEVVNDNRFSWEIIEDEEGESSTTSRMRAMEAALFMIGYEV